MLQARMFTLLFPVAVLNHSYPKLDSFLLVVYGHGYGRELERERGDGQGHGRAFGRGVRFMFSTPGVASHHYCKDLIFSLTIERISTIGIIAERILRCASSQPLLRVHINGLIHFEIDFLRFLTISPSVPYQIRQVCSAKCTH